MNVVPYRCPVCNHETGDFGVGVPKLLTCIDCKRHMCHRCLAKRRLFTRPKIQCRDCAVIGSTSKAPAEASRQGTPQHDKR